jgi:hypothetical protein
MLQYHPTQRLTISDIIGHQWMQGQIATHQEVNGFFAQRAIALNLRNEERALLQN